MFNGQPKPQKRNNCCLIVSFCFSISKFLGLSVSAFSPGSESMSDPYFFWCIHGIYHETPLSANLENVLQTCLESWSDSCTCFIPAQATLAPGFHPISLHLIAAAVRSFLAPCQSPSKCSSTGADRSGWVWDCLPACQTCGWQSSFGHSAHTQRTQKSKLWLTSCLGCTQDSPPCLFPSLKSPCSARWWDSIFWTRFL